MARISFSTTSTCLQTLLHISAVLSNAFLMSWALYCMLFKPMSDLVFHIYYCWFVSLFVRTCKSCVSHSIYSVHCSAEFVFHLNTNHPSVPLTCTTINLFYCTWHFPVSNHPSVTIHTNVFVCMVRVN